MKKITLRNDHHMTSVTLIPNDDSLSAGQIRKAKKVLCGISDCQCSGTDGTRGPQDGNLDIIPFHDSMTGALQGGLILWEEMYEND